MVVHGCRYPLKCSALCLSLLLKKGTVSSFASTIIGATGQLLFQKKQ